MCTLLLLGISSANAADGQSRAGHGHISLTYQQIDVDGFESAVGTLPIGPVETRTLVFDVEYYLNDRIALVAGIPYVRKRYLGTFQHDPLALDPPRPEIENVDQGDWNTGFQDFHFGFRYLLKDGPLVIEPFAFLGIPSHEYPFFGNAAVGQHVLKFDLGSSFTWYPGLSNAYYRGDLAYVFVEKTLGVNINHWRVNAEVGYQFGPRLTGRVFALLKRGNGLTFPYDFPTPRTGEQWYQHDRLVKHNFMNVGIGVDWALNDTYQLTANYMEMAWAEQVHKMEYAFTLGVSMAF